VLELASELARVSVSERERERERNSECKDVRSIFL
jgi:hypothetical protein